MQLVEGRFKTGAKQSKRDKRDFFSHALVGMTSTPFDWSKGFDIEKDKKLTVKDQGESYSCGGQAWSSYGEALGGGVESAKWIYEQTHVSGGGSDGRTNSDLVVNEGWADESVLSSYENGKPPSEWYMTYPMITDKVRLNAKQDKALKYAHCYADIDSVAQAIRDNKGVVLGINGENNGTWLSAFPKAPTKTGWRHWVYAGKAKMMDGKKYIGVLNSWGKDVGENGWQWLGIEFFPKAIFETWTLVKQEWKHTFAVPMERGQENSEVTALQTALSKLSDENGIPLFDVKDICGTYGPKTTSAVFAFQRTYCVKNVSSFISVYTGMGRYAGPLTLAALNKLFA